MTNTIIYLTASCPYCVRAKMLLDKKKVTYTEYRVDIDPELRQEMIEKSGLYSVPQIFIGETHVGGFDDLYELELDDKLDALLNK